MLLGLAGPAFFNLLLYFFHELLVVAVLDKANMEWFECKRVEEFAMFPVGWAVDDFVVLEDLSGDGAVMGCDAGDCPDDTPVVDGCCWIDVLVEYSDSVAELKLVVFWCWLNVFPLCLIFCSRAVSILRCGIVSFCL